MRFDEYVVLSIFIGFVLSPKISKQEKPEDCILFKQYWSTYFNTKGTCAPCPPFLETCSHQGPDKKACEDWCFAKPTIPPMKPATIPPTPTSSYIPPERSNVPPNAFTPGPTIYPSAVHSYEPRESQKSIHFEINLHVWLIVLVVVLSILAILSLVALVVLLLVRKSEKRDETYRDGETGMALGPLQQNNGYDRVHGQNDAEELAHVPNDGEARVHVQNDGDERGHVQNDVDERVHVQNDVDERGHVQNDVDERGHVQNDVEGPVEELVRPPPQPTSSGRLIEGIQEGNIGLSTLDVHVEIHN